MTDTFQIPKKIPNWISGQKINPNNDSWIEKFNPHNGKFLCQLADSQADDVFRVIGEADKSFIDWSQVTPVERGSILGDIASLMKKYSKELADCIALETGKPEHDAKGEVNGSILQAEYFAGEGMRLFGRSLTSGVPNKFSHTVRQPHGVAGLIVPANTPIANIAWKTFPALICGNSVVLKAAEDAPYTALFFAEITKEAGLPDGVFNVIQGLGNPAGASIVQDERIRVISFTGSTDVGRNIAEHCGKRLARVSLELGGNNPLVVCEDADLDLAVQWSSLSAFSNAGQRCAAGSRILIFEKIYNQFREKFLLNVKQLKLGIEFDCDLGPVINKKAQKDILNEIEKAKQQGGKILCGGASPSDPNLNKGYYIEPTIIEGLSSKAELCSKEIFGPVTTLHKVSDIDEALKLSNDSEYGLTAAIHTKNVDRAMWFAQKVKAGVVNINAGTYGSEPHMPFGGFNSSGNGTREPGIEALDVYSELKNISFLVRNRHL